MHIAREASRIQQEAGEAFMEQCRKKANRIRNAEQRMDAHMDCTSKMMDVVREAGDKAFRALGGKYAKERK